MKKILVVAVILLHSGSTLAATNWQEAQEQYQQQTIQNQQTYEMQRQSDAMEQMERNNG